MRDLDEKWHRKDLVFNADDVSRQALWSKHESVIREDDHKGAVPLMSRVQLVEQAHSDDQVRRPASFLRRRG